MILVERQLVICLNHRLHGLHGFHWFWQFGFQRRCTQPIAFAFKGMWAKTVWGHCSMIFESLDVGEVENHKHEKQMQPKPIWRYNHQTSFFAHEVFKPRVSTGLFSEMKWYKIGGIARNNFDEGIARLFWGRNYEYSFNYAVAFYCSKFPVLTLGYHFLPAQSRQYDGTPSRQRRRSQE